jgi:hypothetical protein
MNRNVGVTVSTPREPILRVTGHARVLSCTDMHCGSPSSTYAVIEGKPFS